MAQFLTDTQINSVYELYIGYFNRAPEAGGLNYWSNYYLAQANAGKTDAAIQKDIANQFYSAAVQYNIYTAGTPVADFVKTSYLNALGRTSVDDAGMTYWTAKLTSGEVSRGEFVQKLISDAKGFASDATYGWVSKYLDNRMAVAKAFAAANTTTGDAAITAGKAALSAVTPAAVQAGQTTAQALAAAGFGGTSNEAAKEYVLTTAQDVLTGTTGDDFFRAVAGVQVGSQDQTTLNSSDIIKGGTGTDTLIVNMTGPAYNGGARISGIETLKVGTNLAAATFDYNVNAGSNEVTDVKTIVADQINTGEALTINNLVRDDASTAIPTVSWINDNTGANGLAGTVNVNYRAATVAGTTDEQALSLTNVRAGTLNLATGVEKATLTSAGTATNSIDKVQSGTTLSGTTLTDVVIKADAQLGGARVVSDVTATKGLEINRTATNANTEHTSFVNMGASVKNVTAEGSKAGVNIAFTDTGVSTDFAYKDNTFVGGDGADSVIVNGGNDKLTGGKGADTFIFRQTNTSANGSFFNNSDTIDGGEGSDAIMIDYAKDSAGTQTQTQVVIQTSEWLNSKGLDVLDLRATNTRVQLDDAFVGSNDVGSFEVVTNKIVQSDSTTSVADEANSRHQIDLTTVGASRAVKVTGGEGRESVIVTDALNGVQTVAGGNGLDVLVVQNGATLTGQDLANVSGMNVFNLVKTSGNAQSYQIDLTADFLTKAVDANAAAGTSKNTANAFRILTDTTDGNATAISGVQALAAGDTINITVDTTGLTTAGAINLDALIASGATLTVKNTSGTTLLAAANGVVTTAGTGIFAGAASTANTAYTNLTTNPVAGVGTPVASGQASSGGSSGSVAGNTFSLTAAAAVVATGLAPTNAVLVTGANTGMTAGADVVNGLSFTTATISDATAGDGDAYNVNVIGAAAIAPTAVTGVENVNLTLFTGGTFTATNVVTAANQFINVVTGTGTVNGLTAAHNVNINAAAAGTVTLQSAAANTSGNADFTVSVAGTSTATLSFVDNTAGAATALAGAGEQVTITAASAASLSGVTMGTAALALAGAGNLNLGTVTGAVTQTSTATGNTTATYATVNANVTTNTGADNLTFTAAGAQQVATGTGADVLTVGTAGGATTVLAVNDWANGTDTMSIFAGARANIAMTTSGTFAPTNITNNGILGITGTTGNDVISGTAGRDIVTGGVGIDAITLGGGSDSLIYAAGDAAYGTVTLVAGATTRTAVANWTLAASDTVIGAEVVTGFSTTDASGAQITLGNSSSTTSADLVMADQEHKIVQGTYSAATQTFTIGASGNTGADSLLVWDADSTAAGINFQTVVLVGVNATTAGYFSLSSGVLTM